MIDSKMANFEELLPAAPLHFWRLLVRVVEKNRSIKAPSFRVTKPRQRASVRPSMRTQTNYTRYYCNYKGKLFYCGHVWVFFFS